MNPTTFWAGLRDDLRKHVIVGLAAGAVGAVVSFALLTLAFGLDTLPALALAVALGAVGGAALGYAKEYLWDARGRGTVDREDFLYTGRAAIVGAVLAAAAIAALTWLTAR